MNTLLICSNAKCVNFNVEYLFEGETKTAECGGCHKIIKGKSIEIVVEEAPVVAE